MWKRKLGLAASKPDWPPSPIIVFSHFTGLPGVCHVPLSCVPPWSRLTLNGLTDRLWNCSVGEALVQALQLVGTRDSSCRQRAELDGWQRHERGCGRRTTTTRPRTRRSSA